MGRKNDTKQAPQPAAEQPATVVDHAEQVLAVLAGAFGVFVQLLTTGHTPDANRLLQTAFMTAYADLSGEQVGGVDAAGAWQALAAELDVASATLTNKTDNQPAARLAGMIRGSLSEGGC